MAYLLRSCTIFLFLLSPASGLAQSRSYSDKSIGRLNEQSRELYAVAREQRLTTVSPVVIVRGDNIILHRDGQRILGTTVAQNYHDLKAVAHVPLGLFCALSSQLGSTIGQPTVARLHDLKDAIEQVLRSLPKSFPDESSRLRQASILRQCVAFTESILESKTCSKQALDGLLDTLRPAILKNVEQATKLRIDNYHQQMRTWRKDFSDEEWQRLYVVIPGAALPRKNSTAVQYFAKLLREEGEGRRIIYAESQFDESQDLLLLGTHILDAEVGIAFFGDPWRMQRDLLASAADSYLDTLDFDEFHGTELP